MRAQPGFKLIAIGAIALLVFASSCGSTDTSTTDTSQDDLVDGGGAAGTCLAGDPSCADFDDTPGLGGDDLPPIVQDPGTTLIEVSGAFFADESGAYVCAGLAESFPPQCFDKVATFEGDFQAILEYVGELTGDANPATQEIQNEGDVWWTNDSITVWILPGEAIVRV